MKATWKMWTIMFTCAALAIALLGVGAFGYFTDRLGKNVDTIANTSDALTQTKTKLPDSFLSALTDDNSGEPLNILVLGSDTREGQGGSYGSASVIQGARSDTAMLVHLSGDRQTASVLSIPRDLWVNIPACTGTGGKTLSPISGERFNVAFEEGGPTCAAKTVTSITGIPVNHLVVIDFKGFKKIVNTLGGVPVCISTPVNDPKAHVTLTAGEHVLNGGEALGLARARYTIGDGSDTARIGRQQKLVNAVVSEIQSKNMVTDAPTLYRVLTDSLSSVSADPELAKLPAMAAVAWQMRNLQPKNIHYMTVPYRDRSDGATVAVDKKLAAPMFSRIINDTPWPAPIAKPASPAKKSSKTTISAKKVCANPLF